MNNDVLLIQLACSALRGQVPTDKPLAERLQAVMRLVRTQEHSLFFLERADDDLMFRTALVTVMVTGSEEEKKLVEQSVVPLRILQAMMSGVPVDMNAIPDMTNLLPLSKMWIDSKVPTDAGAPPSSS